MNDELFGTNISFVLVFVSLPFLALAWTSLTKRIFWKSLISISVLAVFIHFENFSSITEDKLLIAIFGGLFLGAGIGLTIKNGAVLDGSEILGIYLNNRFGVSIGSIILIFNTLIFFGYSHSTLRRNSHVFSSYIFGYCQGNRFNY